MNTFKIGMRVRAIRSIRYPPDIIEEPIELGDIGGIFDIDSTGAIGVRWERARSTSYVAPLWIVPFNGLDQMLELLP